jgi:hypothetical protein
VRGHDDPSQGHDRRAAVERRNGSCLDVHPAPTPSMPSERSG